MNQAIKLFIAITRKDGFVVYILRKKAMRFM